MKGCYIFFSNYLEALAEALARIVREPLSDPFASETIVVQSSGMQRWVSMELARHNGVCANGRFPYPNRLMSDLFFRMNAELSAKSPYDSDILVFRIMQVLPECIDRPEFRSLQRYLLDDPKGLKRYQLSRKIADTFDQYLVFRPDMIFNWEAGRADHWQAILWRKLSTGSQDRHRAALRNDLIHWIRNQPCGSPNLPERLSVFGISYLPPFHLQVLAEISGRIPVYLFLMNPCKEYWFDIVSATERVRLERKYVAARTHGEAADLHLEIGNRLLASLGALGKNFFERVAETASGIDEHFVDPGCGSLLACIQSELLHLAESTATSRCGREGFDADRTVQIHSCHSPMREMEVLYDHLLDMLTSDPMLNPGDIIVMTPDIDLYAPYIQAVFDAPDETGMRIPFTIADRSLNRESRVVEAFLSILDLKNSRLGAARVLSLLEHEAVRKKFGLSEADMEAVDHWISATHIRWGRDAASRGEFVSEGFSENSWRQGLDRLLLGYAMTGNDRNMFQGILPYDPMEGGDSLILGKFLEFMEQLFLHVDAVKKEKKLSRWSFICHSLVEKFILGSETVEQDLRVLRKIFAELGEIETLSGYHDKVSCEVVQSMIAQRLVSENYGYGFISGGLTFCAMLPMRSIPFKVICLVGMNSDSFPRENRPLEFDLIAKQPKPGDRSRRNDDKYLFLEALISAREKLYISYIGQDSQDNSEMPPSVLVCELMDYIKSGFGFSEDRILTRHPLQAFSPLYFSGSSRFFSYSEENLRGAESLTENSRGGQEPAPFISADLAVPPEEMDKWKRVALKDFCLFWSNPAKFLLQQRLGLHLADEKLLPEEREHFHIDPLEKYAIGREIVREKLSAGPSGNLLPVFRAQGRLPVGAAGRAAYHQVESEADQYLNKCRPYLAETALPPLDIHFSLAGWDLDGRLEGIYPSVGPVHFHFANVQVKYLLHAWIHHLVYGLFKKDHFPGESVLICKDALWTFDPVSDAKQILLKLLAVFREGLLRPLHFFPETSFAYARQLIQKKKNQKAALIAARQKWEGSEFYRGENQDPYLNLAFRRRDPFEGQFHEAALAVFTPVFQYGRVAAV